MTAEASPREMVATQEEMVNAKLDLGWRDWCAHLLIPLNQCRRREFYLPWKCEHERHLYDKCEYKEYKRRVEEMQQQQRQQRKKK